jgi:hypothetical protein
VLLVLTWTPVGAGTFRHGTNLQELNHCLKGHVDDYTHNHGADRRIWSDALQQPRDLYVDLPPGYDPQQQYPFNPVPDKTVPAIPKAQPKSQRVPPPENTERVPNLAATWKWA